MKGCGGWKGYETFLDRKGECWRHRVRGEPQKRQAGIKTCSGQGNIPLRILIWVFILRDSGSHWRVLSKEDGWMKL